MIDRELRKVIALPALYAVSLICLLGWSIVAGIAHDSGDVAQAERMVLRRESAKKAQQVKKALADCSHSEKIAQKRAKEEDVALRKALDAQKLAEEAIRLHADAQRDAIRKIAGVHRALEEKLALEHQAQELAEPADLARVGDGKEASPIAVSPGAKRRPWLRMPRLVCRAEKISVLDASVP